MQLQAFRKFDFVTHHTDLPLALIHHERKACRVAQPIVRDISVRLFERRTDGAFGLRLRQNVRCDVTQAAFVRINVYRRNHVADGFAFGQFGNARRFFLPSP